MRVLIDALFAFMLLGLTEAIVKPIAKRFVQRRILRAAPLVFAQLDPFMPALLQQCSGAQLEQIVRTKLEATTGESWAGEDLSLLFRLFYPRLACDRTPPAPSLDLSAFGLTAPDKSPAWSGGPQAPMGPQAPRALRPAAPGGAGPGPDAQSG